jgi:hypothetical protein
VAELDFHTAPGESSLESAGAQEQRLGIIDPLPVRQRRIRTAFSTIIHSSGWQDP